MRNRRVKSIVDPGRVARSRGAHYFEYRDGALAVTENHEPVRIAQKGRGARALKSRLDRLPFVERDPYAVNHSSVRRVSVARLRINHYAVKSRAEFGAKLERWQSHYWGNYFAYHDRNEVHDPILHRYTPEMKRRLAERR
jgi:hypothetical protein